MGQPQGVPTGPKMGQAEVSWGISGGCSHSPEFSIHFVHFEMGGNEVKDISKKYMKEF